MEVVVTTGAVNHVKLQSDHRHQQTNIQLFFTGRMPFLLPNQQCQSIDCICDWYYITENIEEILDGLSVYCSRS